MTRVGAVVAVAAVAVAFAPGSVRAQVAPDAYDLRYETLAENRDGLSDSELLEAVIELQWERTMGWHPEFATWVGWEEADHRAWTDVSLAAERARRERAGAALPVLDAIDRDALSDEDRLDYDLFRREVELDVEGTRFPGHLLALNQLEGIQQDAAALLAAQPAGSAAEVEAIVARLEALPETIERTIAVLEEGLARGVTPPRIALRDVPDQVARQIVEGESADVFQAPLLEAFRDLPASISEADRQRLRMRALDAYEEGVVPALHRLHDFLAERYLPGAREAIAASALPDGEAWYAFAVEARTTTDLSPAEIHAIGLREVERIRDEMERVIEETGFEGSFVEFTEFLRTDPRFFHTEADELLEEYRDIAKRADPALARLFGTLPRLPYGVEPVPAYAERSQTTAYYRPGSPEAGRPGVFYANTYALDTRPTWEMEALTLHEAVPGHHLQIAIAQELEDLPEFRRHGGPTAFIEGWGLYAESLGEEMGFYEDPYAKFGQLTYEMWRAVRLVVDTGMHSMGWSRDRAIEYFLANSSKSRHDVTVEIDRYIVWPGQALAYKLGELRIKELRAVAEEELADRFDVRAFHDEVLGAGAIPLDVLESRIRAWIEARKAAEVAARE